LVLVAILFVALWKLDRIASFGVLWLVVTLMPVLNARWMADNVFTERYLYLPSVGFCWVLAWGWTRLVARSASYTFPWRSLLAVASGVIAICCAIRIVTRNADWRDDVTFYTSSIAASPRAFYLHNDLGAVYWAKGDVKSAEREWTKALKLAPNNAPVLDNLALLNRTRRHYEEAVDYSLRALVLDPDDADAYANLGSAYVEMGNIHDAEVYLRTAVALAPFMTKARVTLGDLYLNQGRLPEAEEQFRHSLEAEPNLRGYVGLGVARWRRGDRKEAERCFQQAESLAPSDPRPHYMLGLLYLSLGRNADGEGELRKAAENDPGNQEALKR